MGMVTEVGDKVFKSKKAAIEYYRSILNSYDFNEILYELDYKDMCDLISIHPDAKSKIGPGIHKVRVVESKYKTRCFQIERVDDSSSIFSYTKCINSPLSPMAKFRNACRQAIQEDLRSVKLSYFKRHSIKGRVKCQESNENLAWEDLNVDHRLPNTFSIIVERFVEKYDIALSEVLYKKIDGGQNELADSNMKELFMKYHKEKANLRLVKKELNLSRAHQGRVYRQKRDLVIE